MAQRQARDEQGASMVEMVIIIAIVSLALIASVTALRPQLAGALCGIDIPGWIRCDQASLPATHEDPTPTPTPTPTPVPEEWHPPLVAGTDGTMRFNTAVVDQDQRLDCLSIRVNMSWFPTNWNGYRYPQTVVLDITWTPGLDVAEIIPGSDGVWQFRRIAPNHLRLARTGDFDPSGFQPEPEILLTKPGVSQQVQVTFVATAALTPSVSATSTTWSVPY